MTDPLSSLRASAEEVSARRDRRLSYVNKMLTAVPELTDADFSAVLGMLITVMIKSHPERFQRAMFMKFVTVVCDALFVDTDEFIEKYLMGDDQ